MASDLLSIRRCLGEPPPSVLVRCNTSPMIEWHGWATLRWRADCDDDPDGGETELRRAATQLVESASGITNELLELRSHNGLTHLALAGCHNHVSGVRDLFLRVAETFPGSYGLLYMLDDEVNEAGNSWTCLVMR